MLYLKCLIHKGMFSGERICRFSVGDRQWDSCYSAWMCYRAHDMKQAADISEEETYTGYAKIVNAGVNSETGKAWVRFWFAHDSEVIKDLDLEQLRPLLKETNDD